MQGASVGAPQTMIEKIKKYLLQKIEKYPVITFTHGFLLLITLFRESMDIWFWTIPVMYILNWLLVVWVVSKFPKDELQQKLLRHPIATIVLFINYIINPPFGGGGDSVEFFVFKAFSIFLWWLLICWLSSKIFKKQRFQWYWYKKVIERIFVAITIIHKIILSLLNFITFLLFLGILSFLWKIISKYLSRLIF